MHFRMCQPYISMTSIHELGLKVGGQAYAVIKATSVMVAVDD